VKATSLLTRVITIVAVLALVGIASAQTPNVPSGYTGLWQFATDATKFKASVGTDLGTTFPGAGWMQGPVTHIGVPGSPDAYSDNGVLQTLQYQYLTLTHNIAPNRGDYVNDFTIMMDYQQTSLVALWEGNYYNSLLQTNTGNGNDGDLFIKGADLAHSTIGVGDTGYSSATFDAGQWHRYALSVSNDNFFRVYIDGVLFLDAAGQAIDGRYGLDPTILLFADNDGEDAWGMVGTVATWNSALSGDQIAGMGSPSTGLIVPEPTTMSLLALAGLACWRRRKA
jgi:hypothetical protein